MASWWNRQRSIARVGQESSSSSSERERSWWKSAASHLVLGTTRFSPRDTFLHDVCIDLYCCAFLHSKTYICAATGFHFHLFEGKKLHPRRISECTRVSRCLPTAYLACDSCHNATRLSKLYFTLLLHSTWGVRYSSTGHTSGITAILPPPTWVATR